MGAPEMRLRVTPPELLALPWSTPLGEWADAEADLRELPVGPSRHLVRFVHADGRLWALKEMSPELALREYDVLRELERRQLAAVRVAGVVLRPPGPDPDDADSAVLVTRYLERSWQYRRLFLRVVGPSRVHRARLLDAMALLLVDLHRNGVYWGDCSLANTLFMRDGQAIQAWFVDAETAEVRRRLTDAQRAHDLDIAVENVAGGLLDVAAAREHQRLPGEMSATSLMDEARSVAERYERLWGVLFDAPVVDLGDHDRIAARLSRLHDLGFELDEVRFEPTGERADQLRMRVEVGGRSYHSDRLRSLTGIDAGEGQAAILLNDLQASTAALRSRSRREVSDEEAARVWVEEAFVPGSAAAVGVLGPSSSAVQAYCDLLEVRWLLSEAAGTDVGDEAALEVLARRSTPEDSAATLSVLEPATVELPRVPPPGA